MIPGQEELFRQVVDDGRWAVLTAPAGMGKSYACRCVCRHYRRVLQTTAVVVDCRALVGHYASSVVGHGECVLERMFSQHRVVIIDDFDLVLKPRTERDDVGERSLRQYLTQLLLRADLLPERVIMAGDSIDGLDDALGRRFPLRLFLQVTTALQRRDIAAALIDAFESSSVGTSSAPLAPHPDAPSPPTTFPQPLRQQFVSLAGEKFGATPADLHRLLADHAPGILAARGSSASWGPAFRALLPKLLTEFTLSAAADECRLEELFGMQTAIDRLLASLVEPFEPRELQDTKTAAPPRGIVVYGPSGSGKTHLVMACLARSRINHVSIDTAALRSRLVGQTERNISRVFASARACSPCVLFFDRLELLMASRRGHGGSTKDDQDAPFARVVSVFLAEMDGLEAKMQRDRLVIVVGTTEHFDALDPAIVRPGRLGTHIGVPGHLAQQAKAQLLDHYCSAFPALQLSPQDRQRILARTPPQCTGAWMKQLLRDADFVASSQRLKPRVEFEDFFAIERGDPLQTMQINYASGGGRFR